MYFELASGCSMVGECYIRVHGTGACGRVQERAGGYRSVRDGTSGVCRRVREGAGGCRMVTEGAGRSMRMRDDATR